MTLLTNRIVPSPSRLALFLLASITALIAIWPVLTLVQEAIKTLQSGFTDLGPDGMRQVLGTIKLLLGTATLGTVLGTTNGWLLCNCRFPGRQWLRIAQLIPLATPAYLLSATLIDLGSRHSWTIHGMGWGITVMALTTYPYVFLLSTENFSVSGRRQLEACRSLGVGPWSAFGRVALPIALPAIGAGVALMGMEVVNELGAVQLLGIPSLSAGILETWQSDGNPSGAISLALITLVIVLGLVICERSLRSRSRRWCDGVAGGDSTAWPLNGIRAVVAQLLAIIPPVLSLGTPLLWAATNLDQLQNGWNDDLISLSGRSLLLALAAAVMAVAAALVLAIAKRWSDARWLKSLTFLAGTGYAIPGTVLALALLLTGAPWQVAPLLLLLWGYSVRFLAVAKGGLDAALERISPSLDEAATGMGSPWQSVLQRVHLPLLRGPITVGLLLVFVDTVKELPLTFALRPFDFDTLSVRVFQYAGDERLAEALLPALMILVLGLIAAMALVPTLDHASSRDGSSSPQQPL
ncbi:iron ABC transporter permease [Synechococcus sp. MU1611]|uniref:ABC transporter permease n=1 Tax=Synechococcus sp. MU1611 TaxID=2508345 RepID=UPI001CF90F98|nr:iron ABC transporter permease [Synechococcus sp. MU1611]